MANEIRIDGFLTNMLLDYKNADLIAERVCPVLPVKNRTGYFYAMGKEKFDINDSSRATSSPSKRVTHSYSKTSYATTKHSLHELTDADDVGDADDILDLLGDDAENVKEQLLLGWEKRCVDLVMAAGNYASAHKETLAGTDQWNDYDDSDPVAKLDAAKQVIAKKIGRMPNSLVLGLDVFDALKRHPQIMAIFQYVQGQIITPQMLAEAFGVKEVIVGQSVYNTATEGQTRSMSFLWSDKALLAYIDPTPKRKTLTLAKTLSFEVPEEPRFAVRKWFDKNLNSWKTEVTIHQVEKMIDAECGYLFSDCLA